MLILYKISMGQPAGSKKFNNTCTLNVGDKTTTMFCFDVAICDPVHDVNMITSIKTVSGNLFCIIDAMKTAYYSFRGITYISEKISRGC